MNGLVCSASDLAPLCARVLHFIRHHLSRDLEMLVVHVHLIIYIYIHLPLASGPGMGISVLFIDLVNRWPLRADPILPVQ